MTVTEAETTPEPRESDDDGNRDRTWHHVCCVDDRGICGVKLRGYVAPGTVPRHLICAMCVEMLDAPCEVTCHPWLRGRGDRAGQQA